jgi:hypothetical protein
VSGERQGEWHEWPFEPLPVLRALARCKVEYVLTGDLAAVLQGSPLPTYEIAITPAPSRGNHERLSAALADLGAIALTDVDDVKQALQARIDVSFYTPYGHIDLHYQPAGFANYAALRRNAVSFELEPELAVSASSLRDIVRSRLAAGEARQLPALEATLELAS